VSSGVLYLAIIAIWALFLVPAWLKRPHGARAQSAENVAAEGPATEWHETRWPEGGWQAEGPEQAGEQWADEQDDALAEADEDVSHPDREYRDEVPYYAAETGRPTPRFSQSRQQMLRARRRMLTILLSLTAITGVFAYLGSVQWWICVPPAGMLVLYVLLLREIALADAELASKRQAWEAREARQRAWEASQAQRDAWTRTASEQAAPTAQIIDISGRVGDQLYDQYTDAAVRAVGD
jgi:hypothetical protein